MNACATEDTYHFLVLSLVLLQLLFLGQFLTDEQHHPE